MTPYSEKLPLKERETTQQSAGCSCGKKNQGAAHSMQSQSYPLQQGRGSRAMSNTQLLQVAWSVAVLYLLVKIASK